MRTTLFVLQAAHRQMEGRGGSIVLVTPTVSMSGAARLVPYTTAVEGQRLLAKSAARQWGPDGIRVNCVAPAPEHAPIGVDSMAVSLAPPALGGPGDVVADVAPVVAWLASDAAHFVTGATVCADGGVWMAP
jgi:3-oxoacyl-[acyl-carrier protein] reductase